MGLLDKLRGELVDIIEWIDHTRDTLVWSPGMPGWRPAGEVAALAALLGPPPLPQAG